jgi:hypothetical protein
MTRSLFRILPVGLLLALPPSAAFADINVVNTNSADGIYGNSDTGTSSNNMVNISGSVVGDPAALPFGWIVGGGYSSSDSATNNIVTISNGSTVYGTVTGGNSEGSDQTCYGNDCWTSGGNSSTSNNQVDISGSTIIGSVWGGSNYFGSPSLATVSNNVVTITNSEVGTDGLRLDIEDVRGGYADSTNSGEIDGQFSVAAGNAVTINSGTVRGGVYGGYATSQSFIDPSDCISYAGNVGTCAGHSTATGNTVTITGKTWVGDSTGSYYSSVYGGWANVRGTYNDFSTATVTDNSVAMSGGTVMNGMVEGGFAVSNVGGSAMAANNSVTISGGTVNMGVVGGDASADGIGYGNDFFSTSATATGNSVVINGGSVNGDVTGGGAGADAFTGSATNGSATAMGNSVTINDGTVNGDVRAGEASLGGDTAAPVAVTGNSVTINGGSVNGDIIGGWAVVVDDPNSIAMTTVTGNTVTISGSPNLSSANLYGGLAYPVIFAPDIDARTGNTLNLHSSVTVASAQNFENWNFYLPTTMTNGGTMLTVTGTADIGANAKVNVGIDGASSPLRAGDTVKLIDAGTLTGTLANTSANGQGMQGVTLLYDFNLTTNDKQLLATVASADSGANANPPPNPAPNPTPNPAPAPAPTPAPIVQVNQQAKSLPEGFIAGSALLTTSADHLAGLGVTEAVEAAGGATQGSPKAAQTGLSTGYGIGTFGSIAGGSINTNTGSHVDMTSLSLLAGLAVGTNLAPGRLTLAAFFEYGNGSYDTYNSFINAASIHSDGDIWHLGGGILGRLDALPTGPGHMYIEGSLRAGGVHNDYRGGDLRDAWGRSADYDSDAAYYGAHAGFGYLLHITQPASLDVYAKYFWTRQEGDDVTLSTGDRISFKAVDSHRLRLGGRFAYAVNDFVSPYAGAAYEHEFDGKARATAYGYAIDTPSLKGDTGIGELGLVVKPSKGLPLSCDVGVQGYVGERQGVTGSLQIRYEF